MRNIYADHIIESEIVGPRSLRSILCRVFTDEQTNTLSRILRKKRCSIRLVENRLLELESAIGKDHLQTVMRRSASIIYSGAAEYKRFIARQIAQSESRNDVFAALAEASIGPLAQAVVNRLVLRPSEAAGSISLLRARCGTGWRQALRDKAGPDGRFFLRCPGTQKEQIEALARAADLRQQAVSKRQDLVAGLSDYVGGDEAERLVLLYLDKIRVCSLTTGAERLEIIRSLGRPRARGWKKLPWSEFFSGFESFERHARQLLIAAGLKTGHHARIRALVGSETGKEITSRCRISDQFMRAERRLLLLRDEFGQQAMENAARQSSYIFCESPRHFDNWLAVYRQKRVRAAKQKSLEQQLETVLVEIFGDVAGKELARCRTLSLQNVWSRIETLKIEHPQAWQTIVRTRPSAVLAASKRKFAQEVTAYLYQAARDSDEASLPQAMHAFFNKPECDKAFEKKRLKRLSAEMMMGRLSELDVLRKIEPQIVPRNAAWILVAETKAWRQWLNHRKAKARLILLVQEYQVDAQRSEKRIRTIAKSYKMAKLGKILSRLEALQNAQGESAVADAVRFSWVALSVGSDLGWRRTVSKERYTTVPIGKTIERVSRKYHLAADPPLQVTTSGRFLVCPESRQHIRVFENPAGEIYARHGDLSVLNLYLRLFCLQDASVSKQQAYSEIAKLKAKNALTPQERQKLWMIRSYAMVSHDIEFTNLLDDRRLRAEFEKGLPRAS